MNHPEYYLKYAWNFQKTYATRCLDKYSSKMNWKQNAKIVDLGCGDGSATNLLLKKYLPSNFKELVGVDISKKMVDFANKTYGDDRTKFQVMDIAGEVPNDLKLRFNHAYSSFALNFVYNQEQSFKNIYDMLVPDGNCLLVYCGYHNNFEIVQDLSKRDKWRPWMTNIDTFITRYHYMNENETEEEIKRIVKEVGCRNVEVNCSKVKYVYENADVLRKMMETANVFNVPEDLTADFGKEFIEVAPKYMKFDKNTGTVTMKFNLIEFYGCK